MSCFLRREIRIEYLAQYTFGYTDSLILDGYFDIGSRFQRQRISIRYLDIASGYLQRSATGHRLIRIEHQILDHLSDLTCVDVYG